jgi:hypothetical protein
MPRKVQDQVIGDTTYRVTQLGATTGSKVMFRLIRAFASIAAGLQTGQLSFESMTPEDFDWLVTTMQPTTKVQVVDVAAGNGSSKFVDLSFMFDDHFAGKYFEMVDWLKFALEVNFGPFADVLGKIFREDKAESPSPPLTVSIGSAPVS